MTDRLRGLLEQAVPDDAPTLDPVAVVDAARRSRRRSRAAVGSIVAVAVAAAAAFAVFSGPDGRTEEVPVTARSGPSPYDVPDCPDLPDLAAATTAVASLDGLASVRLCPDLAPAGMTGAPSLGQQKALLAAMDALVTDLPAFAETLAGLAPYDAGRCATIDVLNTRQSLLLRFADGHSVLLPTAACSPIGVGGREVDGQFLGEVYLAALDHQRSTVDYAFHGTVPLTCDLTTSPSPARPGRDALVAGIACAADGSRTVLDGDRLQRLAGEWRAAVPAGPPADGCSVRSDLPYLVVATDHGDVVRIRQDRCTSLAPELAWTDPEATDGFALTTTMADLGLA